MNIHLLFYEEMNIHLLFYEEINIHLLFMTRQWPELAFAIFALSVLLSKRE